MSTYNPAGITARNQALARELGLPDDADPETITATQESPGVALVEWRSRRIMPAQEFWDAFNRASRDGEPS